MSIKDNIEYLVGDSPIVLSAPHGGYLKPRNISNRAWYHNRSQDVYTQELSRVMRKDIEKINGHAPHLIINLLHREKVDANRDRIQGSRSSTPAGRKSWDQYHKFIKTAIDAAIKAFGFAFFIDIHGYPNSKPYVYLGYCLQNKELRKINKKDWATASSITKKTDKKVIKNIVCGEDSLGHFLNEATAKYIWIPSPKTPYLHKGGYIGSGYNTRQYCLNDDCVSGLQLEIGKVIRSKRTKGEKIKGEKSREKFSAAFCEGLMQFLENEYGKW